jgi:hypothetical protein
VEANKTEPPEFRQRESLSATDSPIKGNDPRNAMFCCAWAAIKRDLCANYVLGRQSAVDVSRQRSILWSFCLE